MAMIEKKSARLNLVYFTGTDDDGNSIFRRSGYEVRVDAEPADMLAIGQALASLCEHSVYEFALTENSTLDEL